MDKTDWFSCFVKPVKVGAYETRLYIGESETYNHWNGISWGPGELTPSHAERAHYDFDGQFQNLEWRGLTEKSE